MSWQHPLTPRLIAVSAAPELTPKLFQQFGVPTSEPTVETVAAVWYFA